MSDAGRTVSEGDSGIEPARPSSTPRAVLGGVLMGLANLVPGISGGTMILAIGLYDRFIDAVADVTRLRLRRESLLFLGAMATGLAAAVLLESGVAVRLVAEHRWAMYALFVGMTLGGAPELWRLARPHGAGVLAAVAAGFGAMALFAFGTGESALEPTIPVLLAVGAAGAASMILPGISGSYVLLILGMYDTVIGALSLSEVREPARDSLLIVGPVVIGAGLGIALLSNVLKALLKRFSARPTASCSGCCWDRSSVSIRSRRACTSSSRTNRRARPSRPSSWAVSRPAPSPRPSMDWTAQRSRRTRSAGVGATSRRSSARASRPGASSRPSLVCSRPWASSRSV